MRRHLAILAVGMLAGFAGGMAWLLAQPPAYSSTTLVLLTPTPNYVSESTSGRDPRLITIDTDAHIASDRSVREVVAAEMGIDPNRLGEALKVSAPRHTHVLRLTTTADTPAAAAQAARAAAAATLHARGNALAALQPGQTQQLAATVDSLRRRLGPTGLAVVPGSVNAQLQQSLLHLRERLADIRQARRRPGKVLVRARAPEHSNPSAVEIPLTSGVMSGLLLACAAGAARDRAQLRERRMSSTT